MPGSGSGFDRNDFQLVRELVDNIGRLADEVERLNDNMDDGGAPDPAEVGRWLESNGFSPGVVGPAVDDYRSALRADGRTAADGLEAALERVQATDATAARAADDLLGDG